MTTQNIAAAPPITLEEYSTLPKHPRYELVKGVVELMTASREHERTVVRTGRYMDAHDDGLGEVYGNRGYVPIRRPPPGCPTCLSFQPSGCGPTFSASCTTVPPTLPWRSFPTATRLPKSPRRSPSLNAGGKAVWVIDIDARTLTCIPAPRRRWFSPTPTPWTAQTTCPASLAPWPICCRPEPPRRETRDGPAYAVGQGWWP